MWASLLQWFLEPGNLQLLLCAVIAFGLGLIIGVWIRHSREESSKSIASEGDTAFFKGIHYILSNDHDQAIEEFTKSVQINSDTIETYVALGNLYRSKGDIDRAIRIRQNIILRPNIAEQIKLRALFDLGLDYRKGGFHNVIPEMCRFIERLKGFMRSRRIGRMPIGHDKRLRSWLGGITSTFWHIILLRWERYTSRRGTQ